MDSGRGNEETRVLYRVSKESRLQGRSRRRRRVVRAISRFFFFFFGGD